MSKEEMNEKRLTFKNPDGTWGLNRYNIKKVPTELYGAICKLKDYEEIGTIEECQAAVEKQKAQKPTYEGDGEYNGELVVDTWICPCCEEDYEVDYDDYNYCPNCGQHIDH